MSGGGKIKSESTGSISSDPRQVAASDGCGDVNPKHRRDYVAIIGGSGTVILDSLLFSFVPRRAFRREEAKT
jgi:hypothetical protein